MARVAVGWVRAVLSATVAAGVLAALLLSSGQTGSFIAHSGPTADGELVIHFRGDVSPGQQEALLRAHGASLSQHLNLPEFAVATVPPGRESEIGQALAQSTLVETAETNPVRQPAAAPNDPAYHQQWNMSLIGLDSVWAATDGSGVKVAVIDTGIAYEDYAEGGKIFSRAPDMATTTFVDPYNFYTNDTHADDDYGHGTHVAGTIAENTNNGLSAAGIAPGAQIMPIKVCGTNAVTHNYGCPDDRLAAGIEFAVENGARVINLSIAGPDPVNQAVRTALQHAEDADVVVVAAAGNEGKGSLDYPAAVDSVISVGAVGFLLGRAGYSNYGKGEDDGFPLDVVAPGGDPSAEGSTSVIYQQTYSACLQATNFTTFPEVTACWGTSMATAHVTGIAALIRSKFPSLSAAQVRADLTCSTDDLGAAGADQYYGNGLVRADGALADADHDGLPDCIDPSVSTPHPTPTPPLNECLAPTFTPPSTSVTPAVTPSPNVSEAGVPTDSPTPTPSPTASPTESPTDTPSPTPSETPPESPTETPTETPTATPTPTPTPTASEVTESPAPSPTPTATTSPSATVVTTPRPSCGDVDCNGSINAADALGILRWLSAAAPNVQCIGFGYVNCDGRLDVGDVTVILRHSATLEINLPAGCPGFD